jgi:hypothetical protein
VELVQADLAGSHVLQRDGHILGVADPGKRGAGALVPFQGLFKTVLPMEDVAHVGVQARQAEVVAVFEENGTSPFRAGERLVIPAQVNQGMKGAADGAAHVQFPAQALVDGQGRLVALARRFVLAFQVEDMSHSPQTGCPGAFLADLRGNPGSRSSQPFRLPEIDARQPHYLVVEACHRLGLPPLASGLKKLAAPARVGLERQQLHEALQGRRGLGRAGHQNPFASRIFFSRSRHRPRMNPMDPRARPSRCATSA